MGDSVVRALDATPEVERVIGLARRTPTAHPTGIEWRSVDVRTDDLVSALAGADAVVHLAWMIQPGRDVEGQWATNVIGTRRLLDAAAEVELPALVYASSVGAYSEGPTKRRVDETWPTDGIPSLSYSLQKAYVERILDRFERDHPRVRVVRMRPGLMVKARAASELRRLFLGPLFPGRLAGPTLTTLLNAGPARFQVAHTDDAAEAFREAVLRPVQGPFNLAADPPLGAETARGLLEQPVVTLADAAWRLRLIPAQPGWASLVFRCPLMDISRATTELGWSPQRDSVEALDGFLAGLRHHDSAATPALAP